MTGDRAIRLGTAAVVLAVAGFAAIVSYSNIYDLGRAHGQSGAAARLLPLSVDGLLVAAGLVLLHAARQQASTPLLARCMLWLGIAATVGANVAYGAAFGVLGAVISGVGRRSPSSALPRWRSAWSAPAASTEVHPYPHCTRPRPATGTPHPSAPGTPSGSSPSNWLRARSPQSARSAA